MMDVEVFRAERDEAITRTAGRMEGEVARALAEDDIVLALRGVAADTYRRLHPTASRQRVAAFLRAVRPALSKTVADSDPLVVAEWLSVAAINYATAASAQPGSRKEWVTMRDEDVRDGHRAVHGQTRVIGGRFAVMGERLRFPGEPKGDPAVWIRCRCLLRIVPGTVTAAVDRSNVIVAGVPADSDPIYGVSSEKVPHLTMIWMGSADDADLDSIAAWVAQVAADAPGPITMTVTERGTLGDDDADVLFVDPGDLDGIREGLLADPSVKAAYDAVDQYPKWTPHVTLGYPETPATGEPGDAIVIDRLALWTGDYEGDTFTLGAPMDDEMPDEMPDDEMVDDEPVITEADLSLEPLTWHGVLAPEGVWSGDKRRFAAESMNWRDLPLPLSWQKVNQPGHDGSVVVGQIQTIERRGNLLHATGVWASTPEADEVIGLLAEGHLRGVSVDVDDADITMGGEEDGFADAMTIDKGRICGATICAIPAFAEAYVSLGDPDEDPEAVAAGGQVTIEAAIEEAEVEAAKKRTLRCTCGGCDEFDCGADGCACCWSYDADDQPVFTGKGEPPEEFAGPVPRGPGDKRGPGWITDPKPTRRIHAYWTSPGQPGYAKIRWGVPGDFDRCRKQLAKYIGPAYLNRTCAEWHKDALGYWPSQHNPKSGHSADAIAATVEDCDECTQSVVLVAAADRVLPAAWFADPGLSGPTALTLDGDHVYGHLALWDTCHIGFGEKVCVTAPHSAASYAYFATGSVLTDGGRVPVGQITMNTGHASHGDSARAAAAHYDHTGSAVADVAVGEDEHGIWFSGVLRPGVTEAERHALGAAALSGDWRGIRGNLELVAALAVNVPGFPVPRVSLAASGGRQTALVAAGVVQHVEPVSDDVLVDRVVAALDAREARRARARTIAAQANALRVEHLTGRV